MNALCTREANRIADKVATGQRKGERSSTKRRCDWKKVQLAAEPVETPEAAKAGVTMGNSEGPFAAAKRQLWCVSHLDKRVEALNKHADEITATLKMRGCKTEQEENSSGETTNARVL